MAMDIRQTPFVKNLAANDESTREKALDSLETYLTSSRLFSDLELLKIWKGLFFCIFHTDRPAPQTHLSQKLSALLMRLPIKLFVPFLTAFYTTMSTNYSYIPSLRLDKYLYLIRCYVSSAFYYLSMHRWSPTLRSAYLTLMQGPVGPLSRGVGDEAKVPDGLRYHVLDIWVEELVPVLEEDEEDDAGELLMKAVRSLEKEGRGKALRKKAKESLEEWEKCVADGAADAKIDDSEKTPVQNPPHVPGDDEWEGFGN